MAQMVEAVPVRHPGKERQVARGDRGEQRRDGKRRSAILHEIGFDPSHRSHHSMVE